MTPLSSIWAGQEYNEHLNAPSLLMAETGGATPFRLNLHQGDVGHSIVVGPTGAGKSVLLSLIAMQFRRYEDAQVYIFDKGGSARTATLAMGGTWFDLGGADDIGEAAFQPLANINDANQRVWAHEWICDLIAHEAIVLTPEFKEGIWSALVSLSQAPIG